MSAKAIKTDGKKYWLYKSEDFGGYELWRGKKGGEYSFRAGYVANKDNFEIACYEADEEMRYLMAQGA